MQAALQTVVVALIVIASTFFAAWRLAPAKLKLRVLDALNPNDAGVWGRWLSRRRKGVAEQLLHGCSSCAHAPLHIQKHGARRATR